MSWTNSAPPRAIKQETVFFRKAEKDHDPAFCHYPVDESASVVGNITERRTQIAKPGSVPERKMNRRTQMKRNRLFATLMIGMLFLGGTVSMQANTATVSRDSDEQADTQINRSNKGQKKSKVRKAARGVEKRTRDTSKDVARAGEKTGEGVAKGSKVVAKRTAVGVRHASKATAKGAMKTGRATARDTRIVGKGTEKAGEEVAEGTEKAAKVTANGVEDVSKATARGVEKTGQATASGARKVGRAFKKVGKKIAVL